MERLKIYFNNTPLLVFPEKEFNIPSEESIVFHYGNNSMALNTFINSLPQRKAPYFIITGENYEIIRNLVLRNFNLVKAAGGVVLNEADEVLMIFRRNRWDLPKGHLEQGETLENCAIREVEEETNLRHLKISKFLKVTYHSYILKNRLILKECHWYLMRYTGKGELIPQAEEDIQIVRWIPREEIKRYLDKAWATIRDVLEEVIRESI